jgi:MtN3 and saliva related transmembrane protein
MSIYSQYRRYPQPWHRTQVGSWRTRPRTNITRMICYLPPSFLWATCKTKSGCAARVKGLEGSIVTTGYFSVTSDSATEIIGATAGVLVTLSFLPQVYKVLRERCTEGISRSMYCAFALGVALWILYGARTGSVSIVVSNAVTFVLACTVLIVKLRIG